MRLYIKSDIISEIVKVDLLLISLYKLNNYYNVHLIDIKIILHYNVIYCKDDTVNSKFLFVKIYKRGGNVMENNQNDRRSIWLILFDAIALITATFGSILSSYKILSLVLGIVTCLILVALLAKEYSYVGAVIGVLISIFLMALMIHQILKKPIDEFSDKISEDATLGNIEISVEELIVGYNDERGNKKITSDIYITKEICQEVVLNCIDYDVVLENYKIQDGKIEFSNIPVGTYDIKIKLEGFSQYSGTIKLRENELSNDIWNRKICVQSDNEYKDFEIIISDNDNEVLKGYNCDFSVLNTDYKIMDIISNSDGRLPYTFSMPINLEFQLTLHYNDEIYVSEHLVSDIDNPLQIQFSTPSKEKIQVSEYHQPDDVATMVSLPEWNVDEDMGIDGKRYGGGIKVTISDMFIGMGSNGSKDVVSRITVPLDGNYDETIFSGVFILDQSMYGSNSTGVITILINNEEVFTTGEIGGDTVTAFPFSVDFGDADSIIILTEAHLSGSDFVYGFVAEK